MSFADPGPIALRVARILDGLGIRYLIGGSLASSAHGEPRTTFDVDFVVDITLDDVNAIITALEGDFHVNRESALDCVRRGRAFSAIHIESALKVEFYPLENEPFAKRQMERRILLAIDPEKSQSLYFHSAEDIVLRKLDWYAKGGCVSDKQWRDILGVLEMKGSRLDLDYLRSTALIMGVSELLDKAMRESGSAFD